MDKHGHQVASCNSSSWRANFAERFSPGGTRNFRQLDRSVRRRSRCGTGTGGFSKLKVMGERDAIGDSTRIPQDFLMFSVPEELSRLDQILGLPAVVTLKPEPRTRRNTTIGWKRAERIPNAVAQLSRD